VWKEAKRANSVTLAIFQVASVPITGRRRTSVLAFADGFTALASTTAALSAAALLVKAVFFRHRTR